MALGIGNASNATIPGSETSKTLSHNNNGNLLIVELAITQCGATAISGMGVTYNGVAMTQVGTATNGYAGVWIFKLNSPATGANNIVASWTNDGWGFICAQSFTGSPGAGAETGTFASASADTVNVTSAAGEIVIDIINCHNDNAITVGAGQTQIAQQTCQSDSGGTSGDNTVGAASYEAGAASVTMNWTSTSGTIVIGAVSIRPGGGVIIWTCE